MGAPRRCVYYPEVPWLSNFCLIKKFVFFLGIFDQRLMIKIYDLSIFDWFTDRISVQNTVKPVIMCPELDENIQQRQRSNQKFRRLKFPKKKRKKILTIFNEEKFSNQKCKRIFQFKISSKLIGRT